MCENALPFKSSGDNSLLSTLFTSESITYVNGILQRYLGREKVRINRVYAGTFIKTHLNSLSLVGVPSLAGFEKKRFCSNRYSASEVLFTVTTGSPLCLIHVSIVRLKFTQNAQQLNVNI